MEDWEQHIEFNDLERKGTSLCGENTFGKFAYVSIDHAFYSMEKGSRLTVCPKCAEVVMKQLKQDSDDIKRGYC